MDPLTLALMTNEIFEALRLVMRDLRRDFPEDRFYYFGLLTAGEVLRPYFSACSIEGSGSLTAGWKWSLTNSPHVLFGDEHFATVARRFLERDALTAEDEESEARLTAMVRAMWRADQAGFFGDEPERYVINVEFADPDNSNRDRLCLLNRASALRAELLASAYWPE